MKEKIKAKRKAKRNVELKIFLTNTLKINDRHVILNDLFENKVCYIFYVISTILKNKKFIAHEYIYEILINLLRIIK